jgi:hypothetical protein
MSLQEKRLNVASSEFNGKETEVSAQSTTGTTSTTVGSAPAGDKPNFLRSKLVAKKNNDFKPEEFKPPMAATTPLIAPFNPMAQQAFGGFNPAMNSTTPGVAFGGVGFGGQMGFPMMNFSMGNMGSIPMMNTGYNMGMQNGVYTPAPAAPANFNIQEATAEEKKKLKEILNKKADQENKASESANTKETDVKIEPRKAEEAKPAPVETKEAPKPTPVDQKKEVKKAADDSDDDNVKDDDDSNKDEEEDFSHLPQEKPAKMIYTRDMIMEFIQNEADKKVDDIDDQLEDLMRDISAVKRPNDSYRRGGGRDRDRDRDYRGGKYGDRRDRDRDRYSKGGDYGLSRGQGVGKDAASTPSIVLTRKVLTAEEKKKIEDIKNTTDLIERAKNADEATILKKKINISLFKLTEDNYDMVYDELSPFTESPENCELTLKLLIEKAWSQTKYTKIYAKLCAALGSLNFTWFNDLTEERTKELAEKYTELKDPSKLFKNFVINKIKKEFNHGFEHFKKTMGKAEANTEYNDEDKTTVYNKAKGNFLANMSFIAELYKKKYLPHKVMRTISYQIISNFMTEFCKEERQHLKFSVAEVFCEAFFRIMETCGSTLEDKEAKEEGAKSEADKASHKKIIGDYVSTLINFVNNKEYNAEELKTKMSDDDKKKVNFLTLLFAFFKEFKSNKHVSTRLSSLIENTIHHRQERWPMSREEGESPQPRRPDPPRDDYKKDRRDDDDYRGGGGRGRDRDRDRGGKRDDYYARDSKYERKDKERDRDRNEYAPKVEQKKAEPAPTQATAAPSDQKTNADLEVKSIFDCNKTNDNLSEYIDLFKPDNPALNCGLEELLTAFFKHFTNSSKEIVLLRAGIIPSLLKSFNISQEVFFKAFGLYLKKAANEDIPILKKALAQIVTHFLRNGYDLSKFEMLYHEDPDEKENQKWFNLSVFEEAAKELKPEETAYKTAVQEYIDKHLQL